MEGSIAKRGYLEGFLRGVGPTRKWLRRYYVLYHSSAQCQPRLDYYPDEESFLGDKAVRKTVYIEEIKSVVHHKEEGRPYCLHITTDSQKDHVLSASSEAEAITWLRAINEVRDKLNRVSDMMSLATDDDDDEFFDDNIAYDSLTKCLTFEVVMQQTDAADRCNISDKPFNLVIAKQHMALISKDDSSTMYSWQYSHIRRYGRNKLTFLFEAGRKCPSGPGMFILKTKEGQKIFQEIRGLTRNMRNGSKDDTLPRKKPVQNSAPEEPMYQEPELPKRGYRTTNSYKHHLAPPEPTTAPPPSRRLNIPAALNQQLQSKFADNKKPSPPAVPLGSRPSLGPPSPDRLASLGKVHLVNDKPTEAYTSVYEAKRLDPEYSTADHMRPQVVPPATDPEYAVYDYTASSRYKAGAAAAGEPSKSKPAKPTPSFLAALRGKTKATTPPPAEMEEEYAHLNISATTPFGMPRTRPPPPSDNQYELAGHFDQMHGSSNDNLYDEVGGRG